MTDANRHEAERENRTDVAGVARRAVLKATGAAAALSLGTGAVTATAHGDVRQVGNGSSPDDGSPTPGDLDPVFGLASTGPSPCLDAGEGESDGEMGQGVGDRDRERDRVDQSERDCFDAFPDAVQPSHEVNLHISLPEQLIAVGRAGVLSESQVAELNAAAEDGRFDSDELSNPGEAVQIPGGPYVSLRDVGRMLAEAQGFHYDPAGLRVAPGDVVVFDAETPDHGVAAYHEAHGRQRRVPSGVGPISSPMIPVQGYWLYRFDEAGVYDLYCPPHQVFGMVMRVVVTEDGEVPAQTVEETGRPPEPENLLPGILGGLDPNLPSSAEALASDALAPETIVRRGRVEWEAVVDGHRRS